MGLDRHRRALKIVKAFRKKLSSGDICAEALRFQGAIISICHEKSAKAFANADFRKQ
jgi:hypothetical protein